MQAGSEPTSVPGDERPVLILANLGTPASPTSAAVSAYLDEFLSDPRVVQLPRWLWLPLLRKLILPRRSPVVAGKYASVWLDGGSPLAVHTAALAQAVQARLPAWRVLHAMRYGEPGLSALLDWVILPRRSPVVAEKYAEIWMGEEGSPLLAYTLRLARALQAARPAWRVLPAMRYGQPALAEAITRLHREGIRDITVLPLYPQYSTTPTLSLLDCVERQRVGMQVQVLHDYHVDAGWAEAVAASIRRHWEAHGRGERLLFSFHGLPQRVVDAGDPYARQCEASTQAIAAALGVPRQDILLAYQSRFGKGKWLQPDVVATLRQLAREGVRTVDVACPGFAVDCLETLEEIAIQDSEGFREAGGASLRYIPCLNADDPHADAIAALARGETDWV